MIAAHVGSSLRCERRDIPRRTTLWPRKDRADRRRLDPRLGRREQLASCLRSAQPRRGTPLVSRL